jgi:hypothetical protein
MSTAPETRDGAKSAAKARRGHRALPPLDVEARRLAALVLEVLAGVRTPTQAAEALGISSMRYYQLESRALEGLVAACETRCRGRQRGPGQEMKALRRQNARLERELARQRSLVRLAQRSLRLMPVPAAKTGGRKRRRPVVRALVAAQKLQAPEGPETSSLQLSTPPATLPASAPLVPT